MMMLPGGGALWSCPGPQSNPCVQIRKLSSEKCRLHSSAVPCPELRAGLRFEQPLYFGGRKEGRKEVDKLALETESSGRHLETRLQRASWLVDRLRSVCIAAMP